MFTCVIKGHFLVMYITAKKKNKIHFFLIISKTCNKKGGKKLSFKIAYAFAKKYFYCLDIK